MQLRGVCQLVMAHHITPRTAAAVNVVQHPAVARHDTLEQRCIPADFLIISRSCFLITS